MLSKFDKLNSANMYAVGSELLWRCKNKQKMVLAPVWQIYNWKQIIAEWHVSGRNDGINQSAEMMWSEEQISKK